MLLDVGPLVRHRDFRLVFAGQLVSAFGTFLTYVALPVQIYELTHSSAVVGMLGTVQLVPLAVTALWGGAVADASEQDEQTRALRDLNAKIRDDARVDCCLLTVADGMMLARKR